jgi:hypothetical protein
MKHFLLYLLGSSLFLACSHQKPDTVTDQVSDALGSYGIDIHSKNMILIVPNDGCSGCVNKMTTFASSGNYDSSLLFVFTGRSAKEIIIRMPQKIILNNRILIDSTHQFFKLDLVSEFPKMYVVKDGKIESTLEVDGTNIDSVISRIHVNTTANVVPSIKKNTDPVPVNGMEYFNKAVQASILKHKGLLKNVSRPIKIVLHFRINVEGDLIDLQIVKGVFKQMDDVIIKEVTGLGIKWIPAMDGNQAIEKDLYLPISIR